MGLISPLTGCSVLDSIVLLLYNGREVPVSIGLVTLSSDETVGSWTDDRARLCCPMLVAIGEGPTDGLCCNGTNGENAEGWVIQAGLWA